MEKQDLEYFKTKIEEELKLVIEELKHVGRVNPDNPLDWEPVPDDVSEGERSEKNEVADKIEGFESNTAVLKQLEIRFNELKDALKKIDEGTYGICEKSDAPIERDRLEANPAARTCKAEMHK